MAASTSDRLAGFRDRWERNGIPAFQSFFLAVGRIVPAARFVVVVLFPLGVLDLASASSFVTHSHSQYGPVVLSLFLGGIVAAIVGYVDFIQRDTARPSKVLVALGLSLAGFLLASAWGLEVANFGPTSARVAGFIREVDKLAVGTLTLAFVSLLVSLAEAFRTSRDRAFWRLSLVAVDIPFFLGILIVVAFKVLFENEATKEFHDMVDRTYPNPRNGWAPHAFEQARDFHWIVRGNFWLGFTAGAVSVQLVASQVASALVQITRPIAKAAAEAPPAEPSATPSEGRRNR